MTKEKENEIWNLQCSRTEYRDRGVLEETKKFASSYGDKTERRAQCGVPIIISKQDQNCLNRWEGINEWLVQIDMKI